MNINTIVYNIALCFCQYYVPVLYRKLMCNQFRLTVCTGNYKTNK